MTVRSMTPETPDGEGQAKRNLAAIVIHTDRRLIMVLSGAGQAHCPTTR